MQVILCGVACRLALWCHRGLRIRKAPMDEGMSLGSSQPWHDQIRNANPPYKCLQLSTALFGLVGSLVHGYQVFSGGCRSAKCPPSTQVLCRHGNVEKNRRRSIMHYPRQPDHQQPSRKGTRIPARPHVGRPCPLGPHPADHSCEIIPPFTRPPRLSQGQHPAMGRGVRPEAPRAACLPYASRG